MKQVEAVLEQLKGYLPPVDVERLRIHGGVVGDLASVSAVADIVQQYHSTDADEERVTALLRVWVKLHFDEVELPRLQGSNELDKLMRWEEMPLSSLIAVLTKWFNCDDFKFESQSRPEVASRIWLTLKFELPEWKGMNRTRYVTGSTTEILKGRLIKCLDREEVCKTRLERKREESCTNTE